MDNELEDEFESTEFVQLEKEPDTRPPKTIDNLSPWMDLLLDKLAFMLLALTIYIWHYKIQPKIEDIHEKIGNNRSLDIKLIEVLKDIQAVAGASRVVYGEFHNGGYWASGASKLKFSANLEVCSPSISSVKPNIQNIPVSSLYEELDELESSKNGMIYINVNDDNIKPNCRAHLMNIGVHSTYELLIKCKNEILGIVAVQYTVNNPFKKLNMDDEEKLVNFKNNIAYRVEMFRKEQQKKTGLLSPIRLVLDKLK